MSQADRYPEILGIARREGKVTVEGLAERLGVTVQTIRRDLADLADAGRLERVHGGAILPSGTSNLAYEQRRSLQRAAKDAIARACATAIPDECSVFLNIGTSTETVASELLSHRNLLVVTNNLNVANILLASPDCRIVLTGGELRRADGGLLGKLTAEAIAQYKVDIAVIGCSALDAQGDILDFDMQEVAASQAILAQARRVFLLADHSKLTRTAPARIASLDRVGRVYTDQPLPPALAARCRDWGVEVLVAQ